MGQKDLRTVKEFTGKGLKQLLAGPKGHLYPIWLERENKDLSWHLFISRVRHGWDVAKALSEPLKPEVKRSKYICREGKEWDSLGQYANIYGKDKSYLYKVRKKGRDVEKVLEPDLEAVKDHTGRGYPSFYALIRAWDGVNKGISPSVVHNRLHKMGWTLREAVLTPSLRKNRNKNKTVVISDNSLNPLVLIHEYSHTGGITGDRFFRCTIIETGETKYMNETQVKSYPEGWE